MPMRRKDWPTRHGFTKHPAHTTRSMRTNSRQFPWVILSDKIRLASRYIEFRRINSLCIGAYRPIRTLWQSTVPVFAWARRNSSMFQSELCYPAFGFLIVVGNSGRRPDLCQCVAKIGPRDMVSPNTRPIERGLCSPN